MLLLGYNRGPFGLIILLYEADRLRWRHFYKGQTCLGQHEAILFFRRPTPKVSGPKTDSDPAPWAVLTAGR